MSARILTITAILSIITSIAMHWVCERAMLSGLSLFVNERAYQETRTEHVQEPYAWFWANYAAWANNARSRWPVDFVAIQQQIGDVNWFPTRGERLWPVDIGSNQKKAYLIVRILVCSLLVTGALVLFAHRHVRRLDESRWMDTLMLVAFSIVSVAVAQFVSWFIHFDRNLLNHIDGLTASPSIIQSVLVAIIWYALLAVGWNCRRCLVSRRSSRIGAYSDGPPCPGCGYPLPLGGERVCSECGRSASRRRPMLCDHVLKRWLVVGSIACAPLLMIGIGLVAIPELGRPVRSRVESIGSDILHWAWYPRSTGVRPILLNSTKIVEIHGERYDIIVMPSQCVLYNSSVTPSYIVVAWKEASSNGWKHSRYPVHAMLEISIPQHGDAEQAALFIRIWPRAYDSPTSYQKIRAIEQTGDGGIWHDQIKKIRSQE